MATVRRSHAAPPIGPAVAAGLTLVFAVLSVIADGLAGESGALPSTPGLVPHLALAPIFAWLVPRDGVVGPLAAFAAGLVVDALTSCPLGVTAAAYVGFHFVAAREAQALFLLPAAARFSVFAILAAAVSGVQVGAAIAVGGVRPSIEGFLFALVPALAVYPLAAALAAPPRDRPRLRGLAR